MNKKVTSSFVAAIIGMGVMPAAQANPNLFEKVYVNGRDDNNNYSARVVAENYFGSNSVYVRLNDPSNNLILFCTGNPASNPVKTTGTAKDGTVEINTSELNCRVGTEIKSISMTCSFDGVSYYHSIGNASSIYMGVADHYHSNYKEASADCNVKIDGYELNIVNDGYIFRDQEIQ